MNIEQSFAASVLDARRRAAMIAAYGIPTTEAEQIEGDLSDFHACGTALGYSAADLNAKADDHIEWIDGVPRARDAGANVVLLR
jgi:hypothetical protein